LLSEPAFDILGNEDRPASSTGICLRSKKPQASLSESIADKHVGNKQIDVVIIRPAENPSAHFEQLSIDCPVVSQPSKSTTFPLIGKLYEHIDKILGSSGALVISTLLYSPSDTSKHRSRKWGKRIVFSYDKQADHSLPINHLASWLVGGSIRGEVMAIDFSVDRLESTSIEAIEFIFRATIPSQIWLWSPGSGGNSDSVAAADAPSSKKISLSQADLMSLPHEYSASLWMMESSAGASITSSVKKAMQILREIVPRRTGSENLVLTKQYCAIQYRDTISDGSSEYEEDLPVGWWTSHDDYCNRPAEQRVRQDATSLCSKKATHVILTLAIPRCQDLYAASGYEVSCLLPMNPADIIAAQQSEVEFAIDEADIGSKFIYYDNADVAENNMALEVLKLIEASATDYFHTAVRGPSPSQNIDDLYAVELAMRIHIHANDELSLTADWMKVVVGSGCLSPIIESSIIESCRQHEDYDRAPAIVTIDSSLHKLSHPLYHCWRSDFPIPTDSPCRAVVTIKSSSMVLSSPLKSYRSRRFFPPLAEQRRRLVEVLVSATQSSRWLDAGCGNGSYLRSCLKRCPACLEQVYGIDINQDRLLEAQKAILEDMDKHSSVLSSSNVMSIDLLHASLLDPQVMVSLSFKLGSIEFVSCMEVIEHLPSIADATTAVCLIIEYLQPEYFLISTPNYEANALIRQQAHPSFVSSSSSSTQQPVKEAYREADHKFEFTRSEFREWIADVLFKVSSIGLSYDYEVMELGCRLAGMEATGGATQAVLFKAAVQPNSSSEQSAACVSSAADKGDGKYDRMWRWTRQ
jgi:SAM-dependent methyltransferase